MKSLSLSPVVRIVLPFLVFFFFSFTLSAQFTTCETQDCECEGDIVEMTLYYFGDHSATITVYRDQAQTQFVDQFVVNSGDDFTVSAAGLPGGTFPYYLYFEVDDDGGGLCTTRIFSECPPNAWPGSLDDLDVLGKTFGNLTVFSYTSTGDATTCDLDDIEQDWHVGGNLVGPMIKTLGTRNAEDMIFISSDLERGILTRDGDFGLGTISPNAQLEVSGKTYLNDNANVLRLLGADHAYTEYYPQGDGAGLQATLGYTSPGTANFSINNLSAGGHLLLLPDQNVGVGLSTPMSRLDVDGRGLFRNDDAALGLVGSNRAYGEFFPNGLGGGAQASFGFMTGGNADFSLINNQAGGDILLEPNQNVGIGTSDPTELLDVDGRGLFRNNGSALGLVGTDRVYLDFVPDGTTNNARLGFLTGSTSRLSLENSSMGGDIYLDTDDDLLVASDAVGIGLTAPSTKVHVQGDRLRLSSDGLLSRYIEMNTDANGVELNGANDDLYISSLNNNHLFLNAQADNGKVAINTTDVPGGHELYIGGSMIAEEVVVKLQTNWPDYVFAKDYPQPDIKAWEAFIQENRHLPGLPSAAEMEQRDGVALGETQLLLLEKVEELTLIIIEQQKEIDALKAKMDDQ
ncbi:MAG: hypothetical protein AAFR36_05365 [Bacteroidota bacterium]